MTDRDKQVVALHQQGRSLRSIGRELGVSHVAVGKRLRALAVVTHNGNPGPEPSPSIIEDIQKALQAGAYRFAGAVVRGRTPAPSRAR